MIQANRNYVTKESYKKRGLDFPKKESPGIKTERRQEAGHQTHRAEKRVFVIMTFGKKGSDSNKFLNIYLI